ncbi:MAG: VPS10 domain-containing protein, partial [Terriglobales bacterium]
LTRNDKSKQQPSGGAVDLDMTGAETADTILSISLSPTDKNTIWVGTDDGYVQVTHDGGKTWTNVSDNIAGLPAWGRLQQIEVSPFDPNTCYIAYDLHEMDDDHPYVFKTHDSGRTWTSIAAGLPPDYSARVVREDPNLKGFLVLGTDYGLYRSSDDGATWTAIHNGFPTAAVYDLKFVRAGHDLIVGSHGRGIFVMNDITPWEQMAQPAVAAADFTFFPMLDAYRYARGGGGGGGLNQDPFAVRVAQPPQSAMMQYQLKSAVRATQPEAPAPVMSPEEQQMAALAAQFGFGLPSASRGPVTFEVKDAAGRHVATVHGSGRAGLNQAVWDGNFDPSPVKPPSSGGRGGFAAFFGGGGGGLRALPGRYQITATAPGLPPQTQWVNLKEDPRVKVDMAALEATLRDGQAMQPDIDAMNRMLNGLNSLDQQLTGVKTNLGALKGEGDYDAVLSQAAGLQHKVVALQEEFNPAPRREDYGGVTMFAAEFNGIFRRVSGGDNEMPHSQDLRDWARDRARLQGYLERYNALLRTDVVAFNKMALARQGVTLVAGGAVTLPAAPAVLAAVAATGANR